MRALPTVDLDHVVEHLVRLLHTPSPTGDTEAALALVAGWLQEMGLAPAFTRKGAVVVTLPGRDDTVAAPRAVTGHVDTLGAIVTQIKPNGRLVFDRIGGYPLYAVNGEYSAIPNLDFAVPFSLTFTDSQQISERQCGCPQQRRGSHLTTLTYAQPLTRPIPVLLRPRKALAGCRR